MDPTALSRIFKTLFSHETCARLRYIRHHRLPILRRGFSSSLSVAKSKRENDVNTRDSLWQPRTDFLTPDKSKDLERYPLVTADSLRSWRQRPRRVRMLMRDFIEDSLYNPSYGYFSKEATIFNPGEPFEFNRMKDETEFQRLLARRYTTFEDKLDAVERNPTRQLWHTPTELFRPYYGEAIARYLVENYKLTHHPYHDLTIYEMGAGNGTLMLNILDHIRDLYPEVYEHTQFKVIEISSHLASLQNQQLAQTASSRGHAEHVQIINRSVFGWDTPVPEPCWFLALEVFDNFAHDCIRYHPGTEQPQQASVLIDNDGEFYEFYTSALDPIAERYVRVRNAACGGALPPNHPLRWPPPPLRRLRAQLPFAPAFTPPEYIPTRLLQFFEKLNEFFPLHRLLTSDFHKLPESVPGYNAPVVQTRYKRQTVPVTTPLNHQGFFDILFPTDFAAVEDIYRVITGKFTRVLSHEEFLRRWAYVEDTRTENGDNPMLSWYKNASVMVTV